MHRLTHSQRGHRSGGTQVAGFRPHDGRSPEGAKAVVRVFTAVAILKYASHIKSVFGLTPITFGFLTAPV